MPSYGLAHPWSIEREGAVVIAEVAESGAKYMIQRMEDMS